MSILYLKLLTCVFLVCVCVCVCFVFGFLIKNAKWNEANTTWSQNTPRSQPFVYSDIRICAINKMIISMRPTASSTSIQRMSNLETPSSVWAIQFDIRLCQSTILFAFLLRISWHQSSMCTMFRSGVYIDDYVIFTFSITLTKEYNYIPLGKASVYSLPWPWH